MSTCTQQTMTNHHVPGFFEVLNDTIHVWRQRYQTRHELSHWTERDLHHVGLSWSDIEHEAVQPFWRA